jgi:hypothetical protein
MVKRKIKLVGWGIVGSGIRGVKNLIFKTKIEAIAFRRRVGGRVVRKTQVY